MTNEWDGMTHDYTRKGGIVHAEIMLPAHAPPEFADRSILWNSVEQIEKARDSQLAREIEAALPRELSGEQQLALVRAYVKDNFVDKGMCADFAIHDKGTGNPHVHIMLTLRPLKENGQWGAKCRKAYDLDENGQRIPDGKGGWKNHREDTTDWNDKGNVEIWRAAWAAYTNRALEAAGQPALVDHRSYKRRGIDKIPSVHLGPAASQMEKRGIRTDKGEVNRQIAADNKLLGEIKARITRLYNWSKAEAEKPEGQQPSMIDLWETQQQLKRPDTRTGKIRALQESAALFSFMQANEIKTMQQLHDKISDMNSSYYDLRGKIVQAERRIATLTERGEMWAQYNKYKPIRKQLAKVKPEKRELFEQRHSRELILYDAAARYLKELKDSGEEITPKAWQREIDLLTARVAELKGRAMKLPVSGAFHSPMMEEANKELAPLLRKAVWRKPRFPVYCNQHGKAVHDGESARESLLRQMVSPVRWIETVRNQYANGARFWLELGPKAVLGEDGRPLPERHRRRERRVARGTGQHSGKPHGIQPVIFLRIRKRYARHRYPAHGPRGHSGRRRTGLAGQNRD